MSVVKDMTKSAKLLLVGAFCISDGYEYLQKYIFHSFLIVLMIDLQQFFSMLLVGMVYDFKNNLDMVWKKKDVCFARSVTK